MPPRRVRRQFLEKIVGELPVDEEGLEGMAARDFLVPAHVEEAAAVAKFIGVQGQ